MQTRNDNVAILPDPIPETRNGIILGPTNPSHRTGTVKSVGSEVKWPIIKEGKRFLYVQRNSVPYEEVQVVSEESIMFQVATDIVFSHEELTPENRVKVHLKKL